MKEIRIRTNIRKTNLLENNGINEPCSRTVLAGCQVAKIYTQ